MRTRLLHPGFFTNEHLARLPVRARLLFAGLWCLADREGRIEDRPARIKAAIFPYERVRIEGLICALADAGFVKRYSSVYTRCLVLPTFATNQHPHPRESPSLLPPPPKRPCKGLPKAVPSPSDPVSDPVRDQDQDLTDAPRRLIPFRRYAALGARAIDADPPTSDLGELAERFKRLCAAQDIPYDSAITQKAIDAVLRTRAKRRA